MSAKLTGWISGDQKPIRDGVYQRKTFYGSSGNYSNFIDGVWLVGEDNPEAAANWKALQSSRQDIDWRGVAPP